MTRQWTYEQVKHRVQSVAQNNLPQKTHNPKQDYISKATEQLIKERRQARNDIHEGGDRIGHLTKRIKQSLKKDKEKHVIKTVAAELDVRDRWAGIRALKKEYNPRPYNRKDKEGNIVPQKDRAETAATYLAKQQWVKNTSDNNTSYRKDAINTGYLPYNTGPITFKELTDIIAKLKRHKAPGPDEMPIEIFKELTNGNKNKLLELLNEWWNTEDFPEDLLIARVVLIYKKGDTNLCQNYRPISLLNTMYKIIAAAIQRRIEEGVEEQLQKNTIWLQKKERNIRSPIPY